MAIVYEWRPGDIYQRRNGYEVDGMTVHEAIDAVCGPDCRVSKKRIMGYGAEAVLIERQITDEDGNPIDGWEPYIIIGADAR